MAEPTREEFMRSIGLASEAHQFSVPEATPEAASRATENLERSRITRVESSPVSVPDVATRLGARPGVPFDVNSGVSFMSRLRTAAQPTEAEEEKALKAAYGDQNVRRNSYGWLVVTTKDREGKEKDVLADPLGLDFGDAASVLGQLPEIGGALLAAIKTRGASFAPGIWNAAKTLLATVGGAAAGGAAKDVAVRAAEGEPTQFGEIATRRGQLAALDATLGAGTGIAAKGLGMFISPFSNPGPLQFNARQAQEHFASKYGVRLNLTPAEATGNTFLQRAEAMEMQKPGASIPFEGLLKEREAQIGDLQRLALGGAVPEEEAAGQRALAALGAKTAPLTQNVEREAAATAQAATGELAAGIGAPMNKTALGSFIRQRAESQRTFYRRERNRLYGIVESDPRTQVKNISGDELADEANQLLERQVSVQGTKPGPILGPTGRPIPVTTTEVVEEFSEPGILPKISALQRGRGQQFRLDELIRMRRSIDSDIAQGEALPGVQTRELKQLKDSLTKRITDGLKGIDDKLFTDWKTANDYVASNAPRFQQAGIAEIFRDPEQLSYLGDTALVDRVTSGGTKAQDTYRAYRDFFGASSPEMDQLKQSVRDDVFGRDRIEGLVDAKGFINRVTALAKDAPDVFNDAFGANAAQLRNSARALSVAEGSTLPEDELLRAVNSGNLSGQKLRDMLAAQATKDQAYRNDLIKAVSEGNLKPDRIKPTEFVERFVFSEKTQPADLQGVVGLIQDRPDVLEDIRRLTFKKALDRATAVAPGTGRRTVLANDLEKMLADENMAKRLRTALGTSTFEDLNQLSAFLKPGAVIQQAARSAGGLSAGQQVSALVESGALRYVDRAIKNFFIATAYTSAPIRKALTNTALGPQGKANLVNYAIASTPFLEAVMSTYGQQKGREVVAALKDSIDRSVRENPEEARTEPSREEFMRSIGITQ